MKTAFSTVRCLDIKHGVRSRDVPQFQTSTIAPGLLAIILDNSFILRFTLYRKTHGKSLRGKIFFGLGNKLISSKSKVSGYTTPFSCGGAVRTDSGVFRTDLVECRDEQDILLEADLGWTSEYEVGMSCKGLRSGVTGVGSEAGTGVDFSCALAEHRNLTGGKNPLIPLRFALILLTLKSTTLGCVVGLDINRLANSDEELPVSPSFLL